MSSQAFLLTEKDGSAVDIHQVALEKWFPAWAEPQEFALCDDSRVMLLDTTGHYYEAPAGRFVVWLGDVAE